MRRKETSNKRAGLLGQVFKGFQARRAMVFLAPLVGKVAEPSCGHGHGLVRAVEGARGQGTEIQKLKFPFGGANFRESAL
jgi:hypothetical protein